MEQATEKIDLIKSIRKITILIYIAAFLCFGLFIMYDQFTFLENETERIRQDYTESQKSIVKTQVQAMVELIKLAHSTGISRENILESLSSIRFGADRDGYIFVNTYDGIPLLIDAKRVINGKSIWDLSDPDGVKVIQEERRAVTIPEGDFIYYSWLKLSTNSISPKVSFVKGVPEWEWMIGAGVYLDAIEKDINTLQRNVFLKTLIQVFFLLIIMFGLFIVFLFIFRRFTNAVENEIGLFSTYFDNAAINSEEIDISNIRYREFSHIAEDMNQMVNNKLDSDFRIFSSEQRLLLQREQSPIGYVEYDLDFRITYWNPFAERIFGYTKEEILGQSDEILLPPEIRPMIRDLFNNLLNSSLEGGQGKRSINDNITKTGRRITCEWYNKAITDKEGEILGFVALVDDITERKLVEGRLEKSLEEKQILLKEVHHRVKNNMAIISAFVSLQSSKVEDEIVHSILQSVENRIRSMSLIHEYLYRSEEIKDINVKLYIEELVAILLDSYKYSAYELKTKIDIIQFDLDLDLLIPLGLLINEIISNALKHAFCNIELPELSISLAKGGIEELLLTISDNGIGLPEDNLIDKKDSIGFMIINGLVLQMHGKLEIKRAQGTEYKIYIPLK